MVVKFAVIFLNRGNKMDNILEIQNLKTYYPIKSGIFKPTQYVKQTVDDISFTIKKGKHLV